MNLRPLSRAQIVLKLGGGGEHAGHGVGSDLSRLESGGTWPDLLILVQVCNALDLKVTVSPVQARR